MACCDIAYTYQVVGKQVVNLRIPHASSCVIAVGNVSLLFLVIHRESSSSKLCLVLVELHLDATLSLWLSQYSVLYNPLKWTALLIESNIIVQKEIGFITNFMQTQHSPFPHDIRLCNHRAINVKN